MAIKIKSEWIIGTVLIIAFIVLATMQSSVDGQTGATKAVKKGIVLPAKNDHYNIFTSDGLENFAVEYTEDFSRGGKIESVEGAEILKKYGYKTIISITPDDRERSLVKKYGFNLVELEFEFETIPQEVLEKFVATIKSDDGPFYAHCHGGSHRAGILGMIYRVIMNNWSIENAEKEFVALGGYPIKDKKILDAAKNFLKGKK